MKKVKTVVIVLIVLVVLCGSAFAVLSNRKKIAGFLDPPTVSETAEKVISEIVDEPEPEIDLEYVMDKLEKVTELRTAKITYGCMAYYKEGSVPAITKKSFSMYYEATAYAGVDVSEITCTQNEEGKYIVQLPKATLYEPEIDVDSVEFYSTDKAIFNWTEKEDVTRTLKMAKEDVYHQATTEQLLNLADSNAIDVIRNLLICFLDDEQFEIVAGDRSDTVRVNPPVSSKDDYTKSYGEMVKLFKKAGFKNVKPKVAKYASYNPLAKEKLKK